MKKHEFAKYPLPEVLRQATDLLAESEYLVDRLETTSPTDYLELRMSGQWDPEDGLAWRAGSENGRYVD